MVPPDESGPDDSYPNHIYPPIISEVVNHESGIRSPTTEADGNSSPLRAEALPIARAEISASMPPKGGAFHFKCAGQSMDSSLLSVPMKINLLSTSIVALGLVGFAAAADIPWPEHPRPDFQRPAWVNLNGQWAFAFDPKDEGEKAGWFKPDHKLALKITVPFPWESKLSGIADTEYKGVAWYSREVTLPDGPEWQGKDAWLVIGACDWEATVWVNGEEATRHVGGYMPFDVNLSKFAKPGEKVTVTIRAVDITDPQQPTGKQVHWYTRTSGIWQTVYLEARPAAHILNMRVFPSLKDGAGKFELLLTKATDGKNVRLSSPDGAFESTTVRARQLKGTETACTAVLTAKLKQPRPWSPDDPHLYPVILEVLDGKRVADRVESYFGLREISIAKAPGRDYQYIYLNGKPLYLAGALHQSFHPDGIYHYPNDAVMRSDYELCKQIGINFLRIHIKAPIPRELYWADKLGVLIMQDMPNFWHHSNQARAWYEKMLEETIARDFNHPAIFAWVDFNETWGLNNPGPYDAERQKWVAGIYRKTKELDPTRLVEDNSPCYYDHVETDINSWHFYINDYAAAKKHLAEVVEKCHPGSSFNCCEGWTQKDAPLINSEYGGISAGLGDQDISWCFKFLTNELRLHDKICGYIYTELSDIEWEHNGFVNYDRSPKEYGYEYWHPGFTLKDINNPDFVVIDAPPMIELKDKEVVRVPIRISHWSSHEAKDLKLRWCTHWPAPPTLSPAAPELRWESRPAKWRPFTVVEQEPIVVTAMKDRPVGALLVELLDGEQVLARNYINLCQQIKHPGIQATGKDRLTLTFSPGDFAERTFAGAVPIVSGQPSDWVAGRESGYYQYELELPYGAALDHLQSITVSAELASRGLEEKLDWPARRTPHDKPQTDGKKHPTDVRVSINGVELGRAKLPDDPADARGALSHYRGLAGGYGYMTAITVADEDKLARIAKEAGAERLLRLRFEVPADASSKGGLTLYGAGLGCHGLPPSVVLTFKPGHGPAEDFKQDKSPAVNQAREAIRALVPTAEAGGYEWRFTMTQPAADWTAPEFDASAWRKGRGGFGSRGTPNAVIGTSWRSPEIWLRTEFTLDDPASVRGGSWRIYHDEDVEIYLNGVKVVALGEYTTEYINLPLEPNALKELKKGRNVLAVHCRQTSGGQNVDVGLTLLGPTGQK